MRCRTPLSLTHHSMASWADAAKGSGNQLFLNFDKSITKRTERELRKNMIRGAIKIAARPHQDDKGSPPRITITSLAATVSLPLTQAAFPAKGPTELSVASDGSGHSESKNLVSSIQASESPSSLDGGRAVHINRPSSLDGGRAVHINRPINSDQAPSNQTVTPLVQEDNLFSRKHVKNSERKPGHVFFDNLLSLFEKHGVLIPVETNSPSGANEEDAPKSSAQLLPRNHRCVKEAKMEIFPRRNQSTTAKGPTELSVASDGSGHSESKNPVSSIQASESAKGPTELSAASDGSGHSESKNPVSSIQASEREQAYITRELGVSGATLRVEIAVSQKVRELANMLSALEMFGELTLKRESQKQVVSAFLKLAASKSPLEEPDALFSLKKVKILFGTEENEEIRNEVLSSCQTLIELWEKAKADEPSEGATPF